MITNYGMFTFGMGLASSSETFVTSSHLIFSFNSKALFEVKLHNLIITVVLSTYP